MPFRATLGAYSLGIRNILCLSGDHQIFGNHPTAKNVYDLDSIQLIQLTRRMRDEKLFSGEPIEGQEPRFSSAPWQTPLQTPLSTG